MSTRHVDLFNQDARKREALSDPASFPINLAGKEVHIEPPRIPANLHTDIAEWQ